MKEERLLSDMEAEFVKDWKERNEKCQKLGLLKANGEKFPMSEKQQEDHAKWMNLTMYVDEELAKLAALAGETWLKVNDAKAAKDDKAAEEIGKKFWQEDISIYRGMIGMIIANLEDKDIHAIRRAYKLQKEFTKQDSEV